MPTVTVTVTDSSGNVSAPASASWTVQQAAPPPSSMYIGVHQTTATSADISANPELSIYSGMTQLQTLNKFEADVKAASGFTDSPLLTIGHAFMSGSYNLSGWANTQMSRYPAMILNFKPAQGDTTAAMQATASGSEDAAIIGMVNSIPAGKRVYVTYSHEPQESAGAYATAWRAAQVRWVGLILANRGSKDIHPMICLTTFSFRANNATTQAQFLSVADDLAAAGIDWQNAVVMAPDGYEDDPSSVGGDATVTFADVFPKVQQLGWKRFGITECAAPSKVGSLGGRSITSADVAVSDDWARSLVKMAAQYGMEYVCWFHSTGSKDPIGSWMYTDAIKAVWGTAAHFKGPDPSW